MSSWLRCIVGDVESLKGLSHRLIIGQMFVETFVLNNGPVYTALQASSMRGVKIITCWQPHVKRRCAAGNESKRTHRQSQGMNERAATHPR